MLSHMASQGGTTTTRLVHTSAAAEARHAETLMRHLLSVLIACAALASAIAAASGATPDALRSAALAQGLPLTPQMFGAKGDGRTA